VLAELASTLNPQRHGHAPGQSLRDPVFEPVSDVRQEGGIQAPLEGRTRPGRPLVDRLQRGRTAQQLGSDNDLEAFFAEVPAFNPNAALIKGVVCGIRVEDVAHPLMQKIRYLDKLVDELAKGKALDKILRQ
jgi:hypothetical protein